MIADTFCSSWISSTETADDDVPVVDDVIAAIDEVELVANGDLSGVALEVAVDVAEFKAANEAARAGWAVVTVKDPLF